jgi:hypothetical protein
VTIAWNVYNEWKRTFPNCAVYIVLMDTLAAAVFWLAQRVLLRELPALGRPAASWSIRQLNLKWRRGGEALTGSFSAPYMVIPCSLVS